MIKASIRTTTKGDVLVLLENRGIGLQGVMPLLYAETSGDEEISCLSRDCFLYTPSCQSLSPPNCFKFMNKHD